MNKKLHVLFENFAQYGNLGTLSDEEAFYEFCMESVLVEKYLDQEEFISLFEKNTSEYSDRTKRERGALWYEKYYKLCDILKVLSKKYTFSRK